MGRSVLPTVTFLTEGTATTREGTARLDPLHTDTRLDPEGVTLSQKLPFSSVSSADLTSPVLYRVRWETLETPWSSSLRWCRRLVSGGRNRGPHPTRLTCGRAYGRRGRDTRSKESSVDECKTVKDPNCTPGGCHLWGPE